MLVKCNTFCPKCRGTGKAVFTAREYLGGKVVREWTYESECLRVIPGARS